MKIKITEFALRHFDKKFGGTKILDYTAEEFEKRIQNEIDIKDIACDIGVIGNLIDGYAPFCKLLPIKNFTNARVGSMPITLENYQYIRSGYSARTEKELPVLSRWLELPLPAPKAEYLMLVLYNKEQIEKEAKEQDGATEIFGFDADFGIVAILGQNVDIEIPQVPITILRNALGIKYGGSGVPVDNDRYEKSVAYWKHHAIIK
jgi:hypothetical protein